MNPLQVANILEHLGAPAEDMETLSRKAGLPVEALETPFAEVVQRLDDQDKNKRGVALELLAFWIIRLLGLRFTQWRKKSFEKTAGGEVGVMAASDKIVYSRWQIQCKHTKKSVDIEVIAKEVGMTFVTRADVVMVVTTAAFSGPAVDYANQVTDNSRYYVILLDGQDIARIVADKSKIVDILNVKARRVFAKREFGVSDPAVAPPVVTPSPVPPPASDPADPDATGSLAL